MFLHEDDRQFLFDQNNLIQIHADSLHYAAGGLFRAGLIVVQKCVEHHLQCRLTN